MGLDIIEYVLALESTFGIEIPDEDARHLETPRLLIDYLAGRLPLAASAPGAENCRTQHAFYRARAAVSRRFGVERRTIRPESDLRTLMGARADEWSAVGAELGARNWPRLYRSGWWSAHLGGLRTMGELAKHLALHEASTLRAPDQPWTRPEIERVVLQLLEVETGVEVAKFTLDSRFVRDMGLD